ncbi:dermonecrotic toxin domain-containing protein [Pseudomonas sp. LB3P31]
MPVQPATPSPPFLSELKPVLDLALPQTPGEFGERLIKQKWGADIDPRTALLVTLHYQFKGHPALDGVEQGQVASSRSLLQTLLSNYQTVGDGRFAENAFGLYSPPDIGPCVQIVQKVDEFADHGSGNHLTYEGIYRQTLPQTYGPLTQLNLRPDAFKQWVWELELKSLYATYLEQAWPNDEVLLAGRPCSLRTSVRAAYVMAAWLQWHEQRLSQQGLELALGAAGLPSGQRWQTLTLDDLQLPARVPSSIKFGRLKLYRYSANDIWSFRDTASPRVLLYIPGNSSPLHEFADASELHRWVVTQGRVDETRQALASHFAEGDRQDGTFHAGVLTALEAMSQFPAKHWLSNNAGFFNNDGYWNPSEYIDFDDPAKDVDPFARLVLSMKQAARASVESIHDDAQVNRDNLSAVVEPLVQWINQFGPLALFVPGGEGVLALAGLIDAGYGLDQALDGKTPGERSAGVTRTVFGLLNALPVVGAVLEGEAAEAARGPQRETGRETPGLEQSDRPASPPTTAPQTAGHAPTTRLQLLRGLGSSVASFSDEVLAQIGKVCAIDDDMLRLMQAGRPPTPLLADTINRFKLDQELGPSASAALFNSRYAALQQSEHEWVRLFQQQYPGLPKCAIEQMLDRHGVDVLRLPEAVESHQLLAQLDSKARQYQQHVRLNHAYEGLYLRSAANADSDRLALHSLKNLPGWPRDLRLEILDGSPSGRVIDRCGPLDAAHFRQIIKVDSSYLHNGQPTDFFDAVLGMLTDDERSALHLTAPDAIRALRIKLGDQAISRSETLLGLQRLDAGMTFEPAGLRGGGYPPTAQGQALQLRMHKLQLRNAYPDISEADMDQLIQNAGEFVQAYIDRLNLELEQLHIDLNYWIDQVTQDIQEMDITVLDMADEEAAGMTEEQVAQQNTHVMQIAVDQERGVRRELAEELVAIWQKRGPVQDRLYADGRIRGVRLVLDFEDYHRLPTLSIRFNDVIEMSMRGFHLTVPQTLNGFLQSFPNLEALNLERLDLSHFFVGTEGRALPPVIGQLKHLTSLNLRATELVFNSHAASQLCDLTNLQILDLSDNPLEVPPVLLGMSNLRKLNLRNTRITRCPLGIPDEPTFTFLDLSHNQITRIPQAVLNQSIARDRVLLWNNPLTDEDTLQRLVAHRARTGINLWLSTPDNHYADPATWLHGVQATQRDARLQIWQRTALKPAGARLLGSMNTLSLTAEFRISYLDLQVRVWRLLTEADASPEFWGRLTQDVPLGRDALDSPMAVLSALEGRARLFNDWVALGRPFPIREN